MSAASRLARSDETIIAVAPENGEATRAKRLAEGGMIQCIAVVIVLIGALIAAS